MRIGHIVACNRNYGIGLNNSIPWDNKADMKRFKEMTMAYGVVIMGKNTYDSLPFKDGLPNRKNIVITTRQISNTINTCFVNTMDEAIKYAELAHKEKGTFDSGLVYVIGGAMIYKLSEPYIDFVDITYIDEYIGLCDTYYKLPDNFTIGNAHKSIESGLCHRLYIRKK